MQLHVDTTEVKHFAHRLAGMSRSALPVAVRQTLNSAAFDVKKTTMPAEAQRNFIQRKPNFFKANSSVERAQGFSISTMQSVVGFSSASRNQAVEDLEQQEQGGDIPGRSFIAMDTARVGGSNRRMVRGSNRLRGLKFADPKRATGKNPQQRFIKSLFYAGKGGLVLGQFKGKGVIWRVNSLTRTEDNKFKLTPLYTYQQGRAAKIDKPTHFMRSASLNSAGKLERLFITHAEKQISKMR